MILVCSRFPFRGVGGSYLHMASNVGGTRCQNIVECLGKIDSIGKFCFWADTRINLTRIIDFDLDIGG